MNWVLTILLLASLGIAPSPREDVMPPSATTRASRFTFIDVQIDPKDKALAAYQVEFIADDANVKVVGIEGGDVPAFAQPPYYDPAAMSKHRVIIAAFNTGKDLPTKSFRAARLHLEISGESKSNWEAKLITAAGSDAAAMKADVSISQGAEQ
jgi:hypothetical protein